MKHKVGKPFSVQDRLKSFRYAFNGLLVMLRTQHNARVHLAATVAVCAAGVLAGLSTAEWLWIAAAVGGVWTAEAFNTALELLADAVHPDRHPVVGKAKDAAAAAVLIAAATAALIGLLVFGPHIV